VNFCRFRYSNDSADSAAQSHSMKYNNLVSYQTGGGGRGQLLAGSTGYDDDKDINNGDVSTGRCLTGPPQYFVLDQDYVNNSQTNVS